MSLVKTEAAPKINNNNQAQKVGIQLEKRLKTPEIRMY